MFLDLNLPPPQRPVLHYIETVFPYVILSYANTCFKWGLLWEAVWKKLDSCMLPVVCSRMQIASNINWNTEGFQFELYWHTAARDGAGQ